MAGLIDKSITVDRRISYPVHVIHRTDIFDETNGMASFKMFGEDKTVLPYYGKCTVLSETRVYKADIFCDSGIVSGIRSVFVDVEFDVKSLRLSEHGLLFPRPIDWQPIETVPTDGSIFIGYDPNPDIGTQTMRVDIYGEIGDPIYHEWTANPVRWMPLPDPPIDKRLDNLITDLHKHLKIKNITHHVGKPKDTE